MKSSRVVFHILSICIRVLVFILIVIAVWQVGAKVYETGYRVFTEEPMSEKPGKDVVVEITEGMSAVSIGKVLEDHKLVENGYLFAVQMKLSAYANDVKPGNYVLNTSQTYKEMLIIMSAEEKEK